MNVAIISSLSGGLGHYSAHLARPLSVYCFPKFITYPQVDLSGSVVSQLTDTFVKQNVKWPRFDLDDSKPETIATIGKYLQARRYKLINIHVGTTVKSKITYFLTLMMYLKETYRMNTVLSIHDVFPMEKNNELMGLLHLFYSKADGFTVGNEQEKMKLEKYFDIPSRRITVIPHGIYDGFDRQMYTKEKARVNLGIPEDKKVILFFGWMREYKGFEYLVRAMKILEKTQPNAVVYVASGVKYTTEGELDKISRLIKRLRISDRFILNLNYLQSYDIESVFRAADVVALPYIHESQSGVLMTAMGFQKPVVITDVFSERGWVEQVNCGMICPPKHPKGLADALSKILENSEEAEAMGKRGYEYSSSEFHWEKIAKMYYEAFKKYV